MEYDRALYRVYERVVEDLRATPPPPYRRHYARDGGGGGVGVGTQPQPQQQQRTMAAPIPFYLPLMCGPIVDAALDAATSERHHMRHRQQQQAPQGGVLGAGAGWVAATSRVARRVYHAAVRSAQQQQLHHRRDDGGHGLLGGGGLASMMVRGWQQRTRARGDRMRVPTEEPMGDGGDDDGGGAGGGGEDNLEAGEGAGLRRRARSHGSDNGGGGGGGGGGISSSPSPRRRRRSAEDGGGSGWVSSSSGGSSFASSSSSSYETATDDEDYEASSSSSASSGGDEERATGDGRNRRSPSPDRRYRPRDDPSTPQLSAALAEAAASRQLAERSRRSRRRRRGRERTDDDDDDDDRSIDDDEHRGGCTQKGLYRMSRLALHVAIVHVLFLRALHVTYVGGGVARFGMSMPSLFGGGEEKEIGRGGRLDQTCLEYALSTRSTSERGQFYDLFGDEDYKSKSSSKDDEDDVKVKKEEEETTKTNADGEEAGDKSSNKDDGEDSNSKSEAGSNDKEGKETKEEPPLLGRDEILQIKILYGGECTGQCSRVRNVVYPPSSKKNATDDDGSAGGDASTTTKGTTGEEAEASAERATDEDEKVEGRWGHPGLKKYLRGGKKKDESESGVDPLNTPHFWDEPHYRFATDDALLYIDPRLGYLHNISVVNVTLTERCLSTGTDHGRHSAVSSLAEFLAPIYGMDAVVINQLMYGIRSANGDFRDGHLRSVDTGERWGWRKAFLDSHHERGVGPWIGRKVGLVLLSLLSFFLITSVTSLIVRVLTSSGVVLMFPLFALLRRAGLPGADDRLLGLSYPWIGRARSAVLRGRIHPPGHLIGAHLAKITLYYIMYEACQAAWSVVLYGKSIPEALPVWIYGFAMVWEYFSMVFVRSALSVHFFPRITLLYFVIYHLYFHSVPYGHFDVALIPWFLFMVHAMFHTILAFEVPASARGATSVECPREVYNRLSWPEWAASLPQEWTLFLPLNSRHTPLYDRDVADALDEDSSASDGDGETRGRGVVELGSGRREESSRFEGGSEQPIGNSSGLEEGQRPVAVPLGSDDGNMTIAASDRPGLHARRGGNR